jgi:putative spermidine/putrescine transport system substrate-binding protein
MLKENLLGGHIMKKFLPFLAVCILLIGMLAGCGSSSNTGAKATNSPVTLTIYSVAGGDDYYKDKLIPMFEKQYAGKYKVQYARGTWQDVVNKIKAEGSHVNIDVVISGVDGVPGGAKEGVWEQLYPKYKNEIHYNDLTTIGQAYVKAFNGYGVPLFVSPGGPMLMYNKDKVKNPPTTYADLKTWITANPNKFMYATVPTSGPARGFYFGLMQNLGENMTKPDAAAKTWDYLKTINKDIQNYPSNTNDTFKYLYDGTLEIVPQTPGFFAQNYAAGTVPPNVGLVMMSGAKQIMDAQSYVMPKGLPSDHKKAALDFINFAMDKKAQSQVFAHITIPTNKNATVDQLLPAYKDTYKKGVAGYPKEFIKNGAISVPDGNWILFPNTDAVNQNYQLWQKNIQSLK